MKVGIALSYLLWALSSNFAVFVLARLIGGLSKGNISMAMSIITDVSSPRRRSRAMALVGVAFSLGFIVGPTIGAFFALQSKKMGNGQWFVLPSMLAFAFAIIDILILAFGLRETLPKVCISALSFYCIFFSAIRLTMDYCIMYIWII